MQKSRDWIEDVLDPRPRILEPGPIPTISEFLATDLKWCWAYCERIGCGHSAPIALAPFAIRWGLAASTDFIRERLRCSKCGRKGGVAIKRPSWDARGHAKWPAPLKPDGGNAVAESEGCPMTEEKLHQVLEQLASLGSRPSEQVLMGLAFASSHTYELVLEIYDALEKRARFRSNG